jgi:hypothetical protein
MHAIHSDDKDKYAIAVYEVSHRWPLEGIDENPQVFVEGLFRRLLRDRVSAFDLRLRGGRLTYFVLAGDTERTPPGDIANRLSEHGADARVETVCGVLGSDKAGVHNEPVEEREGRAPHEGADREARLKRQAEGIFTPEEMRDIEVRR